MRSLARFISVCTLVAATTISSAALAGPEQQDLAAAENAYAALDYGTAAQSADQVLTQRGLSHDILVRATRVAALAHAALGHGDVAKQHFIAMLQYDPEFKVDSKLGPRFFEPFSEARGYWQAQGRKPSMTSEATMTYGQPGQVRVNTTDPLGSVKRVIVAYRWAPARDYTNASVGTGAQTVDIPANPNGAGRLDYWVRALDAKDNAIFEDGSPEAPKSINVNEPPKAAKPAEEKKGMGAGFWLIGGGVLVAAGAVVAAVALRPTEYTPATAGRSLVGAGCGGSRCD
jgi:hypothetical protein